MGRVVTPLMRDAEGRQKEASRVKKKLSTPNTCYSYSVGATGLWVHVYTSGSVYVGHEGIARVV